MIVSDWWETLYFTRFICFSYFSRYAFDYPSYELSLHVFLRHSVSEWWHCPVPWLDLSSQYLPLRDTSSWYSWYLPVILPRDTTVLPLSTFAYDLLLPEHTIRYDILYISRLYTHVVLVAFYEGGSSTSSQGPPINGASAGNRTRAARVAGEHSTNPTQPPANPQQ